MKISKMIEIDVKKTLIVLLIIACFLYPFIFLFQGIDFTDTPYILLNCKYYNDLKISNSFMSWLTYFIGHLWMQLFGDSLISFRILYFVFFELIFIVSFFLIKNTISLTNSLWLILLSIIICSYDGSNIYDYNIAGAFFLALFIVLLNPKYVNRGFSLLTGIIAGFAFWCRFPNLVIIVFYPLITFFYYYNKLFPPKIFWKKNLLFFTGFFISFMFIFLIFYFLIANTERSNLLADIIWAFKNQGEGYRLKIIFGRQIKDLLKLIVLLFSMIGFGVVFTFIRKKLEKINSIKKSFLNRIIFIFIFFLIYFQTDKTFFFTYTLVLLAFTYLLIALGMWYTNNKEERIWLLFLFLMILVPTFGSNTGLLNSQMAIIPVLPFLLTKLITKYNDNQNNRCKKNTKVATIIYMKFLLMVFILMSLFFRFTWTYSDAGNRMALTTALKNDKMKYIFTTAARKQLIEKSYDLINSMSDQNDFLVTEGGIGCLPMYLNNIKPFLHNYWMDFYRSDNYLAILEAEYRFKQKFPLILIAKGSSYDKSWPANNDLDLVLKNNSKSDSFIKKYNYSMIYQDNDIVLLKKK